MTVEARHYIDNAPTAKLSGSITSSSTTFTLDTLAGFPASFPYYAVLEIGSASAEVVRVDSATGSTVTVTRNANGLGAYTHAADVTFTHAAVASDFQNANDHQAATTNVHGLTGGAAVVGTTSTQTLTNKTLQAPNYTGTGTGNIATSGNLTCNAVTATGGTISATASFVTSNGAFLGPGYRGQLSWSSTSQALTNGTYTKLTGATVDYDTLQIGGGSADGTAGTITIPADGTYEISATGGHTGATGVVGVAVFLNGSSFYLLTGAASGSSHTNIGLPTLERDFVSGDVLDLRILAQVNGATAYGAGKACMLRVKRIA